MRRSYSLIAIILALTITLQSFASYFTRGKVVASPNNFTPATISNVHADGGNASSSFVKFTRGTTTGQLDYDGADVGIATGNNVFVNQWENASINFITGGNHRAVIASSGLVGIGLTDPTQALQIDKGTGIAGYTQYTAGATTGQAATDGMLVGINSSANGIINVQEALPLSILTSGTEAINVTATQTVVVRNKVEFEDPDSGTNRIAVMASESIASDYTLRLPATLGTVGQYLQLGGSLGATADLVFSTPSASTTTYSWSGYHADNCGCTGLNSTSYAQFCGDASCTLTETNNSGFGTVTSQLNGGNNSYGIIFTPPEAGRYMVCSGGLPVFNNTSGGNFGIELYDGTTEYGSTMHQGNATHYDSIGSVCAAMTFTTSSTTVSIRYKVQGGAASADVGSTGVYLSSVWWTVQRIH